MPHDFHYYEPSRGHGLPHDPFKAIIGPRPIGWIGSVSGEGVLNLAPYSFFNGFNNAPPLIGFSSIGRKDSVNNIEVSGEFSWNLATRPLAEKMNLSSAALGPEVDEFGFSGLTPTPSRLIAAPRVAESPVSFECRATQIIVLTDIDGEPTDAWLVMGQVVGVYIDKRFLKDGIYDTAAAQPIMRGGGTGDYFEIGSDGFFRMPRPRQG
jgi:flavin reductase (DIM6/NTAB) family NADH-FMN oxidoreductase RutF